MNLLAYETLFRQEGKYWWFLGRTRIAFSMLKRHLPVRNSIFDSIEKWSKSSDWELRLIDWFIHSMGSSDIYAKILQWDRYDTWSKLWWVQANIAYSLKNEESKNKLLFFMKGVIKSS